MFFGLLEFWHTRIQQDRISVYNFTTLHKFTYISTVSNLACSMIILLRHKFKEVKADSHNDPCKKSPMQITRAHTAVFRPQRFQAE